MDGNLAHDIDFYYTVRHEAEALFVDEIQTAAQNNPRLKSHIRYSATQGSLSVEEILRDAHGYLIDHHIYICGPWSMIQAFEQKFLACGVPRGNIHYEEFNLR
jgi:predicted ferric reductase